MSPRQKLAIAAAPLVAMTMFPVFRLAGSWLGPERGWSAGMLAYWVVWCGLVPYVLIGPRNILDLLRQRPMTPLAWALVALPPALSTSACMITGGRTEAVGVWVATALINGTLEEVLWRGVYPRLFPSDRFFGLLWPALWFALWHLAPGTLALGTQVWVLVVGAAWLGLALGWVALTSRSILWTAASHALAGVLQR